ncbi:TY-Chap domain-containing protein [Dactylosporangium sp. McL0621]|uniref:TY-Chap domain-containing protein n=1 Tax=Dactylosporangium sp. McL0621 TaxID=3415678 RepID=UPI003CE98660
MSTADGPDWPDVTDELAGTLERLRNEDAVSLDAGDAFVQVIRFRRGTVLSGPVVYVHTSPGAAGLAELGWAPRDEDETVGQPEVPAPVEPATARRLANLIVRTLREVHGVANPAALRYSSFNNNGLRAPQLRTVAPEDGQERPAPDPVTVLPPPAPRWQQWCEILAGGLGDWSAAALDRLAAAQDWQPQDRAHTFTAAGGESVSGHTRDAGHYGHGEISSLTVTLPAANTGVVMDFRHALAGAVAALGHPPLVGDTGDRPFARWRGTGTTVTLAAHLSPRGDRLQLEVEPTEARENLIHNRQKWMMTPDEWSPDELWTTQPDVEDPSAKALDGMLFYRHSPSATLDETLDELRSLFRSWSHALPLLHPYASSARWWLRRPGGDMIAEGAFTPRRMTAKFGWSDQYGTPVSTGPGAGAADALVERVRQALSQAQITAPDQLRAAAWSGTPAERLDASRLTLQRG